MTELALLLRAAACVAVMLAAGTVLARVWRRDADLFAAVWCGIAAMSVAGVVLARAERFSLGALAGILGGAAAAAWLLGLRRQVSDPPPPVSPATRRVRRIACGAAVAACAWMWPPFETFMAAADSTMYVDAGIHLARTGSYEVADSVTHTLPPDLAHALLASVGIFDQGPYVRLPGGLLMHGRDDLRATPAFFPLLPAWTGIFAAVGGAASAPFVAPVTMVLAVSALALFAGECVGPIAALVTALVFLGNFAVWWFGRFTMSESLAAAFVWGGLVFLRRGAPFVAGLMLGIGGVARAETLLFAILALAWWSAWTKVPAREAFAVLFGTTLAGSLAAVGIFGSPNHHVAYLLNDLAFAWAGMLVRAAPALGDGRILTALALAPILPAMSAVAAAWRGRSVVQSTMRTLLVAGSILGAALYLRLGSRTETLRHVGWLAESMSWVGLALALGGVVVVWRRGGSAARFAVVLVALVAVVFVPSPRVADYQPWSMRRYLPVVLPGLALGIGASCEVLLRSPRRWVRAATVAAVATVVVSQVRPVLAVRDAGYFTGSLAAVQRIADGLPPDAIVVVDGSLADLQLQVPLWLVFGRETVMASGNGPAWRAMLPVLLRQGRPVYWIQNRYAERPQAANVTFTAVAPEADFTLDLPNSPADAPPAMIMRKLVPLVVYGVGATPGAEG